MMKRKEKPRRYASKKFFLAICLLGSFLLCAITPTIVQKINNWLLYSHLIGQELAVVDNGDIFLLKFGWTRSVYTLTPLAPSLDGNARFPEWSPDGQWIAFDYYFGEDWDSWRESERSIYIVRADGTNLQRLVAGVSPQWDNSGEVIYYTDWMDNESIKAIDLATGKIHDVLHSEDCGANAVIANYRPSLLNNHILVQISDQTYEWRPDSQSCHVIDIGRDASWSIRGEIALGSFPTYHRLQFQPPANITSLETEDENNPRYAYQVYGGSPSWSPDGRYFIYDSPNSLNLFPWSLYIYDTETRDVYDLGYDFAQPSWRPRN